MEVKIAESLGNGRFIVPYGEGCCTAHKSQISSTSQQEGSGSEVNFLGFGEGSLDPSY